MARRTFDVVDVTEILAHWYAGRSKNQIAESLGLDRKTVCKLHGRESMNTWPSVGEGLIATAIAVVGSVFTYTTNRRAEYDRVLALTAESAKSPIAEDHHTIGKVFEPLSRLSCNRPIALNEDEIAALFRLYGTSSA